MDSVDEILFKNREKIQSLIVRNLSGRKFAEKNRIPFDRLEAYKKALKVDMKHSTDAEDVYTTYEEFQWRKGKEALNPRDYYETKPIRFLDLGQTGKKLTEQIKNLSKAMIGKKTKAEQAEQEQPLTINEELFVQHYLTTRSPTKSAAMAGWTSTSTGNDLLLRPHIQRAITLRLADGFVKSGISVESVLANLQVLLDRCMQGHPVIDQDGVYLGEWKADTQGAIKILELQGKYLKMFSDRVEHTGRNGGPINVVVEPKYDYSKLTGAQLEQFHYLRSLITEVPQKSIEAEYKKV